MIYSSETETDVMSSFVCDSNSLPPMDEEVQECVLRRMRVVMFRSFFTSDKTKWNKKNVYPADNYYTEEAFRESYRMPMMKLLLHYHKMNVESKFDIPITETIQQNVDMYFKNSTYLNQVLFDVIRTSDSNKPDEFVRLETIYNRIISELKESGIRLTFRDFKNEMKKHYIFGEYYVEKHQPNGKTIRSVLLGIQEIPEEKQIEEETDDETCSECGGRKRRLD